MILQPQELKELFNAFIKSSGHPDPVGYIARAILTSEGDPDYVDIDGKMGFLPVHPDVAAGLVGASEVQSLHGNIIATLAMDMMIYDMYPELNVMVTKFHDGLEAVEPSVGTQDIIDNLDKTRQELYPILNPRLATVEDVITLLETGDEKTLSKDEIRFFKSLRGSDV